MLIITNTLILYKGCITDIKPYLIVCRSNKVSLKRQRLLDCNSCKASPPPVVVMCCCLEGRRQGRKERGKERRKEGGGKEEGKEKEGRRENVLSPRFGGWEGIPWGGRSLVQEHTYPLSICHINVLTHIRVWVRCVCDM